MTKDFDEFDHHKPRATKKVKQHRAGFSEDAQDTRATRITFKNYVRGLDEDSGVDDAEEWIIESSKDSVDWHFVGAYVTEEEALADLDDYTDSDSILTYRIVRG